MITTAAKWSIHFVSVVKQAIVNGVLSSVFAKRDERLESVAPFNLGRQVRRASLRSHARRLDRALENHDDLEFLLEQIECRDVVQRRVGRDFVHDRHRPDEEHIALVVVDADFQFVLVVRHLFAFFGHSHVDELRPDAGPDNVRLAHVTHAER